MPSVAIIPARGGSKRIPRKNIRLFAGLPILSFSVKAAMDAGLFDRVIVSTDDHEIAEVAVQFGAEVPFMRSERTSSDKATTADALYEVLQHLGGGYEVACCLYATAPFVTAAKLRQGYHLLLDREFDSVFPVASFRYPTQRALSVNEHMELRMIDKTHITTRSQDLPPTYHDAGQFYWFRVPTFMKSRSLVTENTGALICSELEVQDIDDDEDWQMAELKYKLFNP